jgi:hypothetical protein
MIDFEKKSEPLLPRHLFLRRLFRYAFFSFLLLTFSLGLGILGYHYINGLNWLDSVLNASMILTGMGPVSAMKGDAAKWFASFYAIFSGVIFLTTVAVMLTPLAHRLLHKLHLEET